MAILTPTMNKNHTIIHRVLLYAVYSHLLHKTLSRQCTFYILGYVSVEMSEIVICLAIFFFRPVFTVRNKAFPSLYGGLGNCYSYE